jgi:hypothetical protein
MYDGNVENSLQRRKRGWNCAYCIFATDSYTFGRSSASLLRTYWIKNAMLAKPAPERLSSRSSVLPI